MTAAADVQPCVLVVDDNRVQREQLAELLAELDIPVVGTTDRGEKAIPAIAAALAAGVRVNVVIMDVRMPGIGGLEATRLVRSVFPDVQVLLYSAFGGHLEEQARQVGAFAEIAKGIGVQGLIDTIRHACNARHRRGYGTQAYAAS
jgi:two-component system invasion response regulator UvrY